MQDTALTAVSGRFCPSIAANIWKLYAIRVLTFNLALVIPSIVGFWQSRGLSMKDIMLLQACCATAMACFEVPSGYFADRCGRKVSITLGAIAYATGTLICAASNSFGDFFIAEMLFAFGFSLISGADEAIFYDSLGALGKSAEFSRLWARAIKLPLWTMALGSAVGGYLALVDARWPLYASAISFVAMFVISLTLVEPERQKKVVEHGHLRELFSIAWLCFVKNKQLGWIIAVASVVFAGLQVSLWLYQPYFEVSALPKSLFGWAFAAFNLVAAFGAGYGVSCERKFGFSGTALLTILLIGGSYLLLGASVSAWSVLFIMLHQVVRGTFRVVLSNVLNAEVSSEIRATAISLKNMSERAVYVLALVPVGWLVDAEGVVRSFQLLGLAVIVLGALVLWARPRRS